MKTEFTKSKRSQESIRAPDYYVEIWSDSFLRGLIRNRILLFGDDGIPIVRYVLTDQRNYYNPSTVSIWGFYNLKKYIKQGKRENLSFIRRCLEWLCDNSEETDYGGLVWRYSMAWPEHGLKPGWMSGMAQGLGISLLLRGSVLFKNPEYVEVAEKSFLPMTVSVVEGGVSIIKDDFYWMEEIPSKNPSFVLNGFIFALFGIYDLYTFTGKDLYKTWFDRATSTLVRLLPKYDLGTWSRYDLGLKVVRSKSNLLLSRVLPNAAEMHNIASPTYNVIHISQLKKLYELTGIQQFKYFSRKWSLNPLRYTEFLASLV